MASSFGTEFHATIDEITSLVEGWVDRYPIYLSAFAFPPARQEQITRETIRDVLARSEISSVVFTESPVDPSCQQAHDVAATGMVHLILNIGRLGPTGLAHSFLSTMTVTPTWQKMNRELKKMTTAGATLVFESGKTGFDRNARFTAGAKALAAAGTPLRQFANSTKFVYIPK